MPHQHKSTKRLDREGQDLSKEQLHTFCELIRSQNGWSSTLPEEEIAISPEEFVTLDDTRELIHTLEIDAGVSSPFRVTQLNGQWVRHFDISVAHDCADLFRPIRMAIADCSSSHRQQILNVCRALESVATIVESPEMLVRVANCYCGLKYRNGEHRVLELLSHLKPDSIHVAQFAFLGDQANTYRLLRSALSAASIKTGDILTLEWGVEQYFDNFLMSSISAGVRRIWEDYKLPEEPYRSLSIAAVNTLSGLHQETDLVIAVARGGVAMGHIAQRLGFNVHFVRTHRSNDVTLIDELNQTTKSDITGKRVLLLDKDVVKGRTVNALAAKYGAMAPQKLSLLTVHPFCEGIHGSGSSNSKVVPNSVSLCSHDRFPLSHILEVITRLHATERT